MILEQKEDINQFFDIPVAKRIDLKKNNSILKKSILFLLSFLLLFFFLELLKPARNKIMDSGDNFGIEDDNKSILGHLPYEEVSQKDLIYIEPNITVHKDMSTSLLKMREDAKNEGIYLIFLSGFRSIKLQKEIFYSLKSVRNQNAKERARVSAPPGYSEHSTGFAIDIGDATNRQTDFEASFENTDAFRWLEKNAARYHFRLSFDKSQENVDYEPWHWRYEGSIEALRIFELSNR